MNRDNARGLAQLAGAVSIWKKWTTTIGVVLLGATTMLAAQTPGRQNRISQDLTAKPNVAISGTVHPLTAKATDLGAVNSSMQLNSLTLHIKPSAAQKKEIESLLVSLQDRKSPQYHKWLSQADYGARFGLTESDLSQLKSWVTGQGFTVKHVSTSRNSITFSGKVWQVESAFHTQLHQYKLDGETHFANATALRVPAQFADVVMAVRGLDNFRPKPNARRMLAHPSATFGSSTYISPADWATIYSVSSLYPAFDGANTHVGIVGQSYAPQSDIDKFRVASGLPATKLTYACISTAVSCTDPATSTNTGDWAEADLDIEWAGAIAPNATVDYIYAAAGDTQSVFDALQYAVTTYLAADGNPVPVISMSYNFGCEAAVSGLLGVFDTLGQQAGLQGQTLIVSSGDTGAAGCDVTPLAPFGAGVASAAGGLAVTVPADNPAYTAVGGTTLSGDTNDPTYWDPASGLALFYIPETPWNESSTTGTLAAGGGGESTVLDATGLALRYPTPDWQIGQLGATPTSGRLVPDVAFAAASGHNGYLYCSSDTSNGNACTNVAGGYFSSGGTPATAGGTSVAAPSFAGLVTLFVQRYGPLGNINPALYSIANSSYSTTFHDILTGDTNVPCDAGTLGCSATSGLIGFAAGPGYDQATGLGSVNGQGMFDALASYLLNSPNPAASTTVISATPNPVPFGSSVTLTATVSSPVGSPAGTVTFSAANGILSVATQPLVNGVATLVIPTTTTNGLGAGAASFTATFTPDAGAAYNVSHGVAALTVTAAATTTTVAQPSAVTVGGTINLSASVASTTSSETATGTVTFKLGSTTVGTGTLVNGTATLSVTATTANGFIVGLNAITASYGGDANFAASTGSTSLTVNALSVTTTTIAQPSAVTIGHTTSLSATVASTAAGTIGGTVTFKLGSTTLGTAPVTGGVATLGVTASAANGFIVGPNSITATYSGGTNFATSTGSTTLTVNALPVTPTVVLTPSLTSLTTAQALAVTVAVNATTGNPTPTGSVALTGGGFTSAATALSGGGVIINIPARSLSAGTDTLTVTYTPDTASAPTYNGASNTISVTVTTPAKTTPTVVLTPSSTSITTAKALTVTVAVNATTGNPTPTGSVTLTGGGYTSLATTIGAGSATINIPAGSLSVGSDTLTVTYTPDTASAPTYNGASNTTSVTVTTPAKTTPTMALTPSSASITTAQALAVTIAVSATPTPTGSVILTGGGFTSAATALTAGGVIITVPSGALTPGTDTLTVNYTPDTQSSSLYNNTSKTTSVTVVVPSYTLTATPSSVTVGANGSTTVTLALTTNNYAGRVDFATSVTSTNGTASNVSASAPTSVTLGAGSGSTQTTTMTIAVGPNAANHAPALPWKSGGALVFGAVLLGVPYGRRKRIVAVLLTALAISLAGFMMACGASSGSGKTPPTPTVTARTYKVTVTPTGTSPVANPLPVVITVTVP